VEQNTLDSLGFSLDLIYLASGLGGEDTPSTSRRAPEVEELEQMLRAVLANAEVE